MTITENPTVTPFTPEDLNPSARRYWDELQTAINFVREFDAQDTSGPSGSRRVINSELADAASESVEDVEVAVSGLVEFLNGLDPLQIAGVWVLLNRAYDAGPGERAEAAVKALVEERKSNQPENSAPEIDYSERNQHVDAAQAFVILVKSMGGEAGSALTEHLKLPRRKESSTRTPSGPRFKGNWDFNWAGKRQATKLAEVQKATGLGGLELKKIMAKAVLGEEKANDEKAFAAFLADAPAEFSFPVNIVLVKDQPPVQVIVTAVRQDSDDTPDLEANSEEPAEDNGDDL